MSFYGTGNGDGYVQHTVPSGYKPATYQTCLVNADATKTIVLRFDASRR